MFIELLAVSAVVLLNGRTAVAQDDEMTPCQSVSSMSAAFMSAYPTATAALVQAQVAEDCLKSVPVDVQEDEALIEEMQYFVDWQSNLAWIKNPPTGYTEKKVDIKQQIKDISAKLKDYKDEYSVQRDLSLTIAKAYDFHFVWNPDIMNALRFRRGNIGLGLLDEFAIVSVSDDGLKLPKLYNYFDVIVSKEEGWNPSPITEINNKTAEDYIQDWSIPFPYHEDHARYNRLFPNQAQISTGTPVSQFGRSNTPDGDYTYVKHENGSVFEYMNSASIQLDTFDDIADGNDFFNVFCNNGPPTSNSKRDITGIPHDATRVKKRQTEQPTATGFPTPQVLHSEAVLGGYYLSGSGYEDVAVLSVPSFSPEQDQGPAEFQDITGSFLKDAAAAGKTKLVIDLRGNGGGRVYLGYDMFKQLFPSMDPYGASQFRANEAFDLVGQFMTKYLSDTTYEEAVKDFETKGVDSITGVGVLWQSIFNYKLPLTVENKNFTSWADYFGPHNINGDNFTSISRPDLNNYFSDDLNLDVTGYRTRANNLNKNQPFKSENIVLLQDGGCGSTCAIFSEWYYAPGTNGKTSCVCITDIKASLRLYSPSKTSLFADCVAYAANSTANLVMKNQGGVNQVVVGGIPRTGPMQGVSGSKGSQVYTWTQVYTEASRAYTFVGEEAQAVLNDTDLGKLVYSTRPLMRTAYQATGPSASVINLRDNIRDDDTGAIPLNFVYEAADCRLFYTADMYRDVTNVWKKTVDANWGDKSKVCVEGSTGDKSATAGKAVLKDGNAAKGKTGAATRLGSVGSALVAAVIGLVLML